MELDQFKDVYLVIDKANDVFIQRQFVSQGDYKGRSLTVQVTNNGNVGEVPGLTLNLNWHNEASGLTDLTAFTILDKTNSIFRIEYPENMMTPGKVYASIQIIQDGKVTNLKQFELIVQKLAGQPVGIVEKAEFSALVAALADSNKFRTDIDKKADKTYINDYLSKVTVVPETFANLAAIQSKYPNGANGIMVAADNGHKYIWNGSSWADAGIYQAVGLANGSITSPKLADDVSHRLYSYADSIQKLNRTVDPAFVLGIIDPSTHIPNVSDHSVKIHSRPLSLKSGQVLRVTTPSTANCIIYYYNQGSYVMAGPFFSGVGYTNLNITADQVIIVCGYSGDTTMTSASDLGNQISIVSLNDKDLDSDTSSISDILGIEEVNFTYTRNITTGVGVGNVVDLTQQAVTNYKTALINCSEGDFYLVNGTGGENPRLWAFLNKNNQVITCSDAKATESWLLLIAPKGASALILNQNTDFPCFKISKNLTQGMSINYKEFIQEKSIQLGKYSVGQAVDITPQTTSHYRYIMLSCKDGDRFKLTGRGGNNPRLYGFLDANNVLLSIADLSTQKSTTTSVVTAPKNAATAVFNFQFYAETNFQYSSIAFADSDINSTVLATQSNAIDYKKYPKPQCPQLSEDYMASFVGGQEVSNMFANPLGDLAISTDLMAHCSSFKIINNTIYAAFYVNKQAYIEKPTQHTAVFRRASLSNLSSITNVELCNVGDSVLGQTVNAIYDTVILKKDDDNDNLYLLFTAMLGTDYYLLYRKYTISTDTLSDISKCQFTVNTTTNDFSISGMKQALDANIISYPAFSTDVSFMQQLSTRVENGVTYYYTGIGVLDFCFIAKSSDLINWVFVSQPDFPTTSQFEPAVYVLGDFVYYLCRQDFSSSSYAFLTTYNLVTHVWATPINIPDCQSRSVFFTNSGNLYALHAPKDRNHIAILHIDTTHIDQSADIAVADVDNMFYPFIQDDNGHLYVTITQARKHIWLCNFSVPDTSVSISKLKQVLGS